MCDIDFRRLSEWYLLQSGVIGVLTGLTRTLSRWIYDVAYELAGLFHPKYHLNLPPHSFWRLTRASQFR